MKIKNLVLILSFSVFFVFLIGVFLTLTLSMNNGEVVNSNYVKEFLVYRITFYSVIIVFWSFFAKLIAKLLTRKAPQKFEHAFSQLNSKRMKLALYLMAFEVVIVLQLGASYGS